MPRSSSILAFLAILMITACSPTLAATELPVPASDTPPPLPTETSTPEPSATPIPTNTLIPTSTSTATPTPDYSQVKLERTFAVYEQYSQVFLNMGTLEGEYYAIGRHSKLENIQFRCAYNPKMQTELICDGASIPFGYKIYFTLYKTGTDEPVYDNTLTFTGPIPSPTGVVCEVEPLTEAYAGDVGCFAITCYQDGIWYGGSENTCKKPWPFEWKYTYP